VSTDVLRIGFHILAASVWVGGQIVLAGIVPALRDLGPDATRTVAQRFNVVAWSAYVLLLFTGIWNVLEVIDTDQDLHPLLEIKLLLFVLSGVGAFVHMRAHGNKVLLAVGGAMSSLFAVAALFVGVALSIG
jgi:putative copper export protein